MMRALALCRSIALAALAIVAACGGGSGGGGPVETAPPFLPNLAIYAGDPAVRETLDGKGTAAHFAFAKAIASDAAGNLYVLQGSAIRKIAPDATVTTVLAQDAQPSYGPLVDLTYHESLGLLATTFPTCLKCQRTATVVRFPVSGTPSFIAALKSSDGSAVTLGDNAAITPDLNGDILVASSMQAVLRLSADGNLTTIVANYRGADFNGPTSIAVDSQGSIYVSDTGSHSIRKILPEGQMFTLAGGTQGAADGVGSAARFSSPGGIAVDAAMNVWVADTGNHAVRRISPEGKVTTVVGQLGKAGFAPGALPAGLETPRDVAVVGHDLFVLMDWGVAVVRNGAY